MLVTASGRTRTFRCGTGSEYGSLFFALELVDWEHVHPEAIAQAESVKKPIEHSGRMIGIGGKRPVPADLVEHVGRIDGVDPESYVLGYGLSRRLNKGVSAEEVVRAIGEDEFVLVRHERGEELRLDWLRRSAVTGFYAMKSSQRTIVKTRSDGPYRDEDDLIERGFHAHDLDIEEARRLFDRSSRDSAWRTSVDNSRTFVTN